jgi:hypothetical protein
MTCLASCHRTINERAAVEKITWSYVSGLLRLTLLASGIVEAIFDGPQPRGMTLPAVVLPFPVARAPQTGCPWQSPTLLVGGPNRSRSVLSGRPLTSMNPTRPSHLSDRG